MARSYTVATSALALGVGYKWLDNILSHFHIPGVEQQRQGIRRKLSLDALICLRITILLVDSLRLPVAKAISLASDLKVTGRYQPHVHSSLAIDLQSLQDELLRDLDALVEVAPVPRRGRPPKQTGRLA